MGVMAVVLVVGALVLVLAVILRLSWRGSGDERQSVNDYHRTLETLRHVSDRGGAKAPREQSSAEAAGPGGEARREARARDEAAAGASTAGPVATPSKAVFELASTPDRYRRMAGASRHGSKSPRLAPVALTTAMIVLLVALLVFGLTSGSKGHSPSSASHKPATAASGAGSATTLSRSGSAAGGAGGSRSTTSTSTSSSGARSHSGSHRHETRTTIPPAVQPTTFTAAEAAYSAPVSSYVVSLSASGPCWVLASEPEGGTVIWQGTLEAGQTRQIPAAGSLFLRLGAAFAVTVSLNGEPVVLPAGHGSPYDVTFQAT
jgi:hypothetical protein